MLCSRVRSLCYSLRGLCVSLPTRRGHWGTLEGMEGATNVHICSYILHCDCVVIDCWF
jgi:hypothetical protein